MFAAALAAAPAIPNVTSKPPSEGQRSQAHAKTENNVAAQDQRGTEHTPIFVKVAAALHNDREAAQKADNRKQQTITEQHLADYTWYLVLATIAWAAIAFVQAALFVWQLFYIRRGLDDTTAAATTAAEQTKLTRSEYIAANRPRLRVRKVELDLPVVGALIKVRYEVVNIGGTNAHIIDNDVTIRIRNMPASWVLYHGGARELTGRRQFPFANYVRQGEALIAEGEILVFNNNWGFDAQEQWWGGRLYVIGMVRYSDDNEVMRRTAFYRVATDNLNRFEFVPGFSKAQKADLEYED